MTRPKREKRNSSPQALETKMLEAHARGVPITDLEYDEVTGLLDVSLARVREAAAKGAAQVRDLAHTIAASSQQPRRPA